MPLTTFGRDDNSNKDQDNAYLIPTQSFTTKENDEIRSNEHFQERDGYTSMSLKRSDSNISSSSKPCSNLDGLDVMNGNNDQDSLNEKQPDKDYELPAANPLTRES